MPKGAKRQSRFHGVVAVDKPEGMTSQDVVNVVRRAAGTRRVGHTGTLDPLATGLLLVLIGEATKLSEYMVGFDKVYEGTMRLGVQSDTHDRQGDVQPGPGAPIPDLPTLRRLTAPLTGEIDQVPPAFSAVKVRGRKLYEYAREGEPVEVEARRVRVDAFDILEREGDTARFRVACSSGTYVRSLVHELGQAAGCGALVQELRRTHVEDFDIAEAVPLDRLREAGPEGFGQYLLPMLDALTAWPIYYVEAAGVPWLHRGQAIPAALGHLDPESTAGRIDDLVYLCPVGGDALAVARVVPKPPSRPPAQLARHVGLWFQPVKLLTGGE
ncbi:MAG: tRNA pseudouridine(55) synthase TruB [Candidatus Sumerlaeia bacterium]|nr:tRNA pseudouridine(55) synthase TruB [Candidatus Sumerlaeia bacterium]